MAGLIRTSASDAAKRYADRLAGSSEVIRQGVEKVTEAPGVKAAQSEDRWWSGLSSAKASGKWARRVAAVDVGTWKQLFLTKGLSRIGAGAQAAVGKMTNFYDRFFPHLESGLAEVNRMPNVTLEDRIQRAVAMMRHNAKFVF